MEVELQPLSKPSKHATVEATPPQPGASRCPDAEDVQQDTCLQLLEEEHEQQVARLGRLLGTPAARLVLDPTAHLHQPLPQPEELGGLLYYPKYDSSIIQVPWANLGLQPSQIYDECTGFQPRATEQLQDAFYTAQRLHPQAVPSWFTLRFGHDAQSLQQPDVPPGQRKAVFWPMLSGHRLSHAGQPGRAGQHDPHGHAMPKGPSVSEQLMRDYAWVVVGWCAFSRAPEQKHCGAQVLIGQLHDQVPDGDLTLQFFGQGTHSSTEQHKYQHAAIRDHLCRTAGIDKSRATPREVTRRLNELLVTQDPGTLEVRHPRGPTNLPSIQQSMRREGVTSREPDPWRAALVVDAGLRALEEQAGNKGDLPGIIRDFSDKDGCHALDLFTASQVALYTLWLEKHRALATGLFIDGTNGLVHASVGKDLPKPGKHKRAIFTTVVANNPASRLVGLTQRQCPSSMAFASRFSDDNTKPGYIKFLSGHLHACAAAAGVSPQHMLPRIVTTDHDRALVNAVIQVYCGWPGGEEQYAREVMEECLAYADALQEVISMLPAGKRLTIGEIGFYEVDRLFDQLASTMQREQAVQAAVCEPPVGKPLPMTDMPAAVRLAHRPDVPDPFQGVARWRLRMVQRPAILAGRTIVRLCLYHFVQQLLAWAKYSPNLAGIGPQDRRFWAGVMVALFAGPAQGNTFRGPDKTRWLEEHLGFCRQLLDTEQLNIGGEWKYKSGGVFMRVRRPKASDASGKRLKIEDILCVLELPGVQDVYGNVLRVRVPKLGQPSLYDEVPDADYSAVEDVGSDGSDEESDVDVKPCRPASAGCCLNPLHLVVHKGNKEVKPLVAYYDRSIKPLVPMLYPLLDPLVPTARPYQDRSGGSHRIASHATTGAVENWQGQFKNTPSLQPFPKRLDQFVEVLYHEVVTASKNAIVEGSKVLQAHRQSTNKTQAGALGRALKQGARALAQQAAVQQPPATGTAAPSQPVNRMQPSTRLSSQPGDQPHTDESIWGTKRSASHQVRASMAQRRSMLTARGATTALAGSAGGPVATRKSVRQQQQRAAREHAGEQEPAAAVLPRGAFGRGSKQAPPTTRTALRDQAQPAHSKRAGVRKPQSVKTTTASLSPQRRLQLLQRHQQGLVLRQGQE